MKLQRELKYQEKKSVKNARISNEINFQVN